MLVVLKLGVSCEMTILIALGLYRMECFILSSIRTYVSYMDKATDV